MRKRYAIVALVPMVAGCLSDVHYTESDRERAARREIEKNPRTPVDPLPPSTAMVLGPTVHQEDPPPPISGGNVEVTPDGTMAVVADPDRDAIYLVPIRGDVLDGAAVRTIPLTLHDEPGRIAIDERSERAYVALRRSGGVVAIDLATGTKAWLVEKACPAPRGIAWDKTTALLYVACVGGEIVTIPKTGLNATTRREEGLTDLRDIIVTKKKGKLLVTTFRTSEVVTLAPLQGVVSRERFRKAATSAAQTIAWRTLAAQAPAPNEPEIDDDELYMVGQYAGSLVVPVPAGYYVSREEVGVGAVPVVSGPDFVEPLPDAVLPVDIAVSSDKVAIAAAGNGHSEGWPTLILVDRPTGMHGELPAKTIASRSSGLKGIALGQVTSVAFTPDGRKVVAFSREPATLFMQDAGPQSRQYAAQKVSLSNSSREDTGHAIFHSNAGRNTTCASCHAEGRDDGHAWESIELGARRTPSLIGTVASTAPYHWNGEARDMTELMAMTFTGRMGGQYLLPEQSGALDKWLTKLPRLPAASLSAADVDRARVERGRAVFESSSAKCSTCHAGPAFTNNQTVGSFQVPSLINVSFRAPYLHDGSKKSLTDVLAKPHGEASLSPEEAAEVITFLNTL